MFWFLLLALSILLLIDVPLLFVMGIISFLYYVIKGIPFSMVVGTLIGSVDSFPLIAVPLFILVGQVMNMGGVTKSIFNFAQCLVGHIPGGLAHVNVFASVIFAGMSGSSIADAAGLGALEMKAMNDAGFDKKISGAITAVSSLIGPIIPPSIPMVVYSAVSGCSLGRLLIAGIVPGLMMGVGLMVYIYLSARKNIDKYPISEKVAINKTFREFIRSFPALLTPVILLAGIASGIFTPTEGALVALAYSLFIGFFIYKELKIKDLIALCYETCKVTGVVLGLLAFATIFVRIMAIEGVIARVINQLIGMNPYLLLLTINIGLLIAGCFFQVTSALILFGPILIPLIISAGISPIQFGVIMVLNLIIGTITPPVAATLFSVAAIADLDPVELFRACIPFLIPILIILLLVTYIPGITLLIPNYIFG